MNFSEDANQQELIQLKSMFDAIRNNPKRMENIRKACVILEGKPSRRRSRLENGGRRKP